MKSVVFAGGIGQRLWPLSRKHSPKQFEAILGPFSTIQATVERIRPLMAPEDIYISTNERYRDIIQEQLPELLNLNYILEPARRDLAAAVGLAFFLLEKRGVEGPVAILWSDSYVGRADRFRHVLRVGERLIDENPNRIIFLGEKPRFPNENLGWIELGGEIGTLDRVPYYEFKALHYRPKYEVCVDMFESGNYTWNTGYFMTSVSFITAMYRALAPQIARMLEEIVSYDGTDQAQQKLNEIYPSIPVLSFDEAILEPMNSSYAILLQEELQWSDPGSLYALKEALQASPESNVLRGKVATHRTRDSLLYNFEESKLLAAVGLDGMIVVNMEDVLLVIPKQYVPMIKELLAELEGSEHVDYT